MNWYRVKTQHDNFRRGDIVLLEGGAREAALEQMGYLEFVRVEDPIETGFFEPEARPKRGRRGKSAEAGSPEGEPVEQVSGD